MARNTTTRKPHVSMRGKIVDMDLLRKKNELTPAMGNAKVNARGDELGPGGKIVRKREDIIREYYEKNPNAVRAEPEAVKATKSEESKATVEKNKTTSGSKTKSSKTAKEIDIFSDEWEEDADGNFIKKGEK